MVHEGAESSVTSKGEFGFPLCRQLHNTDGRCPLAEIILLLMHKCFPSLMQSYITGRTRHEKG
jgi:hypothetical protein